MTICPLAAQHHIDVSCGRKVTACEPMMAGVQEAQLLSATAASIITSSCLVIDISLHPAIHLCIILLAYSQMGGLEGEALQEKIFLLLVFACFAGKNKQQKFYSRGPAALAAPAGELASSIMYMLSLAM